MSTQGFTVQITPIFETEKVIEETIGKFWMEFQMEAHLTLPRLILTHMKHYINGGTRRARGSGNLASAMTIWRDPDTRAHVHWGIGHIPTLMAKAPYYYVVNYGKMFNTNAPFIPGGGMYRPIMFGNSSADPSFRGNAPKGNPRASKFRMISTQNEKMPSPVRPINYIEKTNLKLEIAIRRLLMKLRSK